MISVDRKKLRVTFFGASYKIAQAINRIFTLQNIVCEERHFNLDLFNYAMNCQISFWTVQKRSDLVNTTIFSDDFAISYGTGIIFKSIDIYRFKHGIWNIHPGKLPENRGRHPISWSFLDNDRHFTVTIHLINSEIDQGYILGEANIQRDLHDSQAEIIQKIESLLEGAFLTQAADAYFFGERRPLEQGRYRERMDGKYSTINSIDVDSSMLFNLFKCQQSFGGVTLNGRPRTQCHFVNSDFLDLYKAYELVTCRDGKIMAVI